MLFKKGQFEETPVSAGVFLCLKPQVHFCYNTYMINKILNIGKGPDGDLVYGLINMILFISAIGYLIG